MNIVTAMEFVNWKTNKGNIYNEILSTRYSDQGMNTPKLMSYHSSSV